jgi:DNA (cytosine-5)-methyltransferase 1
VRYLSLFSGLEAATVAWSSLGWRCVAVAEIEPFPRSVLANYYAVPNLGDVTKITEADIAALGSVDLLVFGSPCQDLSVAGKRAGLEGARSGLFYEAIRILGYARKHCGLRWAVWENVPGAFSSSSGADFAVVVGELAGCAAPIPPKGWGNEGALAGEKGMVEWSTLDAQWFGVAQRRRRVFAVADFGNWRGRSPVLLEPESLRGDTAPRRETGQSVAGTLEARTRGGGFPGSDGAAAAGHVVGVGFGVSPTLRAGGNATGGHRPPGTDVDTVETLQVVSPAVTSKWAKGTGGPSGDECQNLVAFHHNAQVDQMNFSSSSAALTCSQQAAVALRTAQTSSNGCGVDTSGASYTLDGANGQAVVFESRFVRNGRGAPDTVCPPLKAQSGESGKGDAAPLLASLLHVRRLTPRECERLQGFPDDYTAVLHKDKPAADGPRYKALGNSMAVPVMRWVGERIDTVCLV